MRRTAVYCNRVLASKLKRTLMLRTVGRKEQDAHDLHPDSMSYRRLIKYLPEPIFVHDGDTVIFTNQAGLRLLGVTEAELLAKPFVSHYFHPDYRETARHRLQAIMGTDEPNEFEESKLVSAAGEMIDVEVSSTRIRNYPGRGTVVQSVFRDIRDRKREEEALIQSEKLSVVGQMAAGIAHEIRNPLTSLIGFSKFLKTRINSYHDFFDIMLVELDRINTIVQEFMALAKPQANQFRRHDLVKTIQSVLTLLETQAIMNNVQLSASYDAETAELLCEENQLKQVFVNVLKNAIEAMPQGGSVAIRLKSAGSRDIAVSIEDQGIGIPEEQLPMLGGPFFTTKDGGTGLGLMICYRIIEGHRGRIDIASAHGKGTTVTISLPKNE
ncbi:ATP-binding protein [Paenibacillus sp. GCM10023250]|uniref:ATP-binding protein n=1 Tax=Paenibacillus sp. GCM10023250 TaxID=3252648 RepID=UPI003616C49C